MDGSTIFSCDRLACIYYRHFAQKRYNDASVICLRAYEGGEEGGGGVLADIGLGLSDDTRVLLALIWH